MSSVNEVEESMRPDNHRVIVWSTGGIGSLAIGAVQGRPDQDLVGVWVHSPDKVGRDAGELANGIPIGVKATNDAGALLALEPDCVIYGACGPERDAAAVPDYVRLLEAGVNVITTTSTHLVNPASFPPRWLSVLEAAAAKGGATLYAAGINPGFALDQLPLVLATQSKSINSIYLAEIGLYDDYAAVDTMRTMLGFGMPLSFEPVIGMPGVIAAAFGGEVKLIADELGLALDEIIQLFDRVVTERPLDVAFGHVEAGTCGAIRMRATGVVKGRDVITFEHVTRLAPEVAPDWPNASGAVTYRIIIDGDPDLDCTLVPSLKDPEAAGIGWMSSGAGAMMATAKIAMG